MAFTKEQLLRLQEKHPNVLWIKNELKFFDCSLNDRVGGVDKASGAVRADIQYSGSGGSFTRRNGRCA